MGEISEGEVLAEEALMSEFERVNPDYDDWRKRGVYKKLRRVFVWTDKERVKHKLKDIDDNYLQNIINFLKRKIAELPDFDFMPNGSEGDIQVSNERLEEHYQAIIDFLSWEQRQRAKEKKKGVQSCIRCGSRYIPRPEALSGYCDECINELFGRAKRKRINELKKDMRA